MSHADKIPPLNHGYKRREELLIENAALSRVMTKFKLLTDKYSLMPTDAKTLEICQFYSRENILVV